jgi:putative transposase
VPGPRRALECGSPSTGPGGQHEPQGQLLGDAVAESFFGSLKKERIKKQTYKNRELAVADVADYIDSFYNQTRRHSHIGGVSPDQFEAAHRRKRVH